MELTNKYEAYYRPDFSICELLKQANFNYPTSAFFNPSYTEMNGALLYPYNGGNFDNWNKEKHLISAPFIPIVLVWLKELGYFNWTDYDMPRGTIFTHIHYGNEYLGLDKYREHKDQREADIHFIEICCKHRIETLKTNG